MKTLLIAALLLGSSLVHAEEFRYVLGASVNHGPDHAGSRRSETSLAPVWALHWGRWRISGGGGSALMGFGAAVYGAGASADLFSNERLRVGLSLRGDGGRRSKDAELTQGLPDVRRTLRGRLFASYALAPDWQLSAALSQDLLGREGGMTLGLDLGWRLHNSPRGEWTASAGLAAANGRHLRSYFGVTPQGSLAAGLPEYRPGAGLRDIHAGLGYTRALGPRWIVFASAGVSRLLGPAADSPLSQRPSSVNLGLGLAYRN